MTKEDIVDYFNKVGSCKDCTFERECDAMYDRVRCSTTNTFRLCDVITNPDKILNEMFLGYD